MKHENQPTITENEDLPGEKDSTTNPVDSPKEPKSKKRLIKALLLSSLSIVLVGVTGVSITHTIHHYKEAKSPSVQLEKIKSSFAYVQDLSLGMDAMEHEYIEDASIASTTTWKMKFQENINQIRETSKTLDSLSDEDKDKKVLQYKRILHSIADGYEMRLEGIKEQDMELIQRGSDLIYEAKAEMNR